MAALHPRMKWCEREDKVYLTIELPDAKDAAVTIEAREFTFRATAAGATYEERIALFADVSKEKSTYAVTARQVFCVLIKEEAKWWERLVREGEKKPANLHVDFDRWADEDDDAGDVDTSGFDMQSMMGGGGGMGGGGMPGGMDFSQLMAGMGGGGAGGGARRTGRRRGRTGHGQAPRAHREHESRRNYQGGVGAGVGGRGRRGGPAGTRVKSL